MLGTQHGYFYITKKPGSICFLTSSLVLRAMSSRVLLSLCFTDGHSSLWGNLWITIYVDNPGITWYDQASTSTYSWRSLVRFSFPAACKATHILISFLSFSVPRLMTFTDFGCGWMILAHCFSSMTESSGSSQSSSPFSSAWLIWRSKSNETIAVLLLMDSWVALHVYDYAFI